MLVAAVAAPAAAVTAVSFSTTSMVVGASADWTVNFTTSNTAAAALATGDKIVVSFPSNAASHLAFSGTPAALPNPLPAPFTNCSGTVSAAPTVTITLANSGGACALPKNSSVILTINGLKNPTRSVTTVNKSSFTVKTTNSVGTTKDTPGNWGLGTVAFSAESTPAKLLVVLGGETADPGSLTNGKMTGGTPPEIAAATTANVTVQAVDTYWNKVTTVTDTFTLTSSDLAATLPSPPLTLALGTWSGTVTLNTPLTTPGQTLTATDPGLTANTSAPIPVYAANGSGTMTVDQPDVSAGATGKTLTFTYTAAAGGIYGGSVALIVPANWPAPLGNTAIAFSGTGSGTLAFSGQEIDVGDASTGLNMSAGETLTITYGTGAGVTVPAVGTSASWAASEYTVLGGTLTSLGVSPSVTVQAADGSGTMAVSPTSATAGSSTNTLTFTYTAASGGMSGGTVRVAVPAGWTAPNTTSGTAGYTVASTGTVTTAGSNITVTGVTLAGAATMTITYGSGAAVTAPTSVGTSTFTTTENSSGSAPLVALAASPSVTVAIGAASIATSTISAASGSITADGSSTSAITVRLKNAFGVNLAVGGDIVALSTTAGTLSAVTDNGDSTYSATLTAPTSVGSTTVSGTVNGSPITSTATVTFTAGAASVTTSTITAAPGSITADGSSTSAITVSLKDAYGNSRTGSGDAVVLSTTGGTLSAVTPNGNGTYSATLTAPSSVGSGLVSGTVNGSLITGTATVTFTAVVPSAATSTISAASGSITADGSSTSAITVRLKTALGTNLAVGGDTVVLSTTGGTLSLVTDNGDGTYTATLTAPSSAGGGTVSGTVNAAAIVSTATVTFTAGAASGATSTIGASPGSITADGSSTSAITVRLKDALGNSLTGSGGTVALSTTGGTLSAVTDNGNGTYSATLTAPSSAGSGSVSGTLNAAAIASTATVTFTAAPPPPPGPASGGTSTIGASPAAITADGSSTSTITVRLKDASGTNLTAGGDTVALSTTGGTLSLVIDNGDGTYTATLTSPSSVGSGTVSGTVNGTAIASTASVTFTAGAPPPPPPPSGPVLVTCARPLLVSPDGLQCLPPPPPPPPITFVRSSPADGAALLGADAITLTANHMASWYAISVVGPDGGTTQIPSGYGVSYSKPFRATQPGAYTLTATMDDGYNPAQRITARFTIVPTRPDVALPGKAGSVESADGRTTVNWTAGTFTEPVQVNVDSGGTVGSSSGLRSHVVRVTVVRLSDGTKLQAFAEPLELVFNAAEHGVPSFSEDGVNWTPLPALSSNALPAGQTGGYFRDASGAVHVLTRHLTFFGILAAHGTHSAKLTLTVTGTAVRRAGSERRIAVRLHITTRATIRASLSSPAGKLIEVWTRTVTAGASTLNLTLPAGAVYRGACTVVLRATAGGQATLRTVAVSLR